MGSNNSVAVVTGEAVARALEGKERAIMDTVAQAYRVHARGETALPHSCFLRFPGMEKERIIALPAFLGGDFRIAGIKWISSFPENINRGLERASALLVLNALDTGRVYAVLESSIISAARTAASAALAVELLARDATGRVGLVGCGLISFQILRFLQVMRSCIRQVVLFDIDRGRAARFRRACVERLGVEEIAIAPSLAAIFDATRLVSFATTATMPHVPKAVAIQNGTVILHVSLRDLAPSLILAADNVVDDIDAVCRANTSVHLAEQRVQNRAFIRCTLGEILTGKHPALSPEAKPVIVFSPFGLGVLDVAVGHLVYREAVARGSATNLPSFHPQPWLER